MNIGWSVTTNSGIVLVKIGLIFAVSFAVLGLSKGAILIRRG